MAVEGRIVSHYNISYILVNCNFIDFMSLFRHSVCSAFLFFPFRSRALWITNFGHHSIGIQEILIGTKSSVLTSALSY